MSEPVDDLLVISLQAAVPLHIAEVSNWPPGERTRRARRAADVVASHGDNILFKSKKSGDTAHAFNELAIGLAILAFQPGGVSFAGCHWVAAPSSEKVGSDMPPGLRWREIEDVPVSEGRL